MTSESELPPETDDRTETSVQPKYDDPYAEPPTRFRSLSAVEAGQNDAEPNVQLLTDFVTPDGKLCPGSSGKESPRNVSEPASSPVLEQNGDDEAGKDTAENGCTKDNVQGGQIEDESSNTYDEPWDLRAARLGLECRLRAAHTSNPALTSMQHTRYDSRYKTMDPRPAMEYDEPWDRRARDVQRTIISAKSAKEEARMLRDSHAAASHIPLFSSSTCRMPDASRHIDHSLSKHGKALFVHLFCCFFSTVR